MAADRSVASRCKGPESEKNDVTIAVKNHGEPVPHPANLSRNYVLRKSGFNRNQGNVQAAGAELGKARYEVSRVQNELAGKLAGAHGQFTAAKKRADRYRTSLLPNATKSYELSLLAFKGGQFEYIRVIQAQRTVAEARLEYIRALGDAWRAASEIAGLTLEDDFPTLPMQAPQPGKK
jgi:cobalt-zinc-cadmium efflux system outer membrane protein